MATCKFISRRLAGIAGLAFGLAVASGASAETAPAFERFDKELKAAIGAQDVVALSLLVKFPLRINHSDGGVTSLDNPRALQVHFAEVFTPEVRQSILDTKPDDRIVRSSDIGYGGGLAWVEEQTFEGDDTGFRIKSINLVDPKAEAAAAKALKIGFVCETRKHRIVIEEQGEDPKPRYRVWNRPKALNEKPDLEITEGTATWEGSGVCASQVWKFPAGKSTIEVSGLACGPGDEPDGAIGMLTVTTGESVQSYYCF
jgi:hypothetical protein